MAHRCTSQHVDWFKEINNRSSLSPFTDMVKLRVVLERCGDKGTVPDPPSDQRDLTVTCH